MLDRLLEVGSYLNWFTPLAAEIQDIMNGPSHTFLIPEESCGSGRELSDMLREHGVRSWGLMIVNHTLMLTVRKNQARWADYLLLRAGVPVLNPITAGRAGPLGGVGAAARGRHGVRSGGGLFEGLNGLLDSVADRLGL